MYTFKLYNIPIYTLYNVCIVHTLYMNPRQNVQYKNTTGNKIVM